MGKLRLWGTRARNTSTLKVAVLNWHTTAFVSRLFNYGQWRFNPFLTSVGVGETTLAFTNISKHQSLAENKV